MTKDTVQWACVYLAKLGNMVKVGVTNDPAGRAATLQIGLPEELTMPYIAVMPTRAKALLLEKSVHRQLAHRHARGEWFRVDIEEAIAVVDRTFRKMRPARFYGAAEVAMPLTEALRLADAGALGDRLKAIRTV